MKWAVWSTLAYLNDQAVLQLSIGHGLEGMPNNRGMALIRSKQRCNGPLGPKVLVQLACIKHG